MRVYHPNKNQKRITDMKRILFSLLTLMATAAALHADNLSVPDTPMAPGATQTVDIALTNTATDYLGFQMTLSLPAGVSPVKAQCALSDRFDTGQELSIGRKSDGTYTLFWASLDNAPISGTSGAIIHLALSAGDSYTGGTATLSGIRLANSQGQRVTLDNCSFALTLAISEPYVLLSTDGKTLSFRYDCYKNFSKGEGTVYELNTGANAPGWFSAGSAVTTVVFDSSFATVRPTSTYGWFQNMAALTTIEGLGYLHTDGVTDMTSMFSGCSSLFSLDLSSFVTSSVTDMHEMFRDCSGLTSLIVSGFDTSSVTNIGGMFYNCTGLTTLDVSGFDTSSVTDMGGMFYNCTGLTSLDVSGFDTSSVTDMGGMFYNCTGLTSLDVSGFDTSSATSVANMFYGCSHLTSLDLSHFVMGATTSSENMLAGCSTLKTLTLSDSFRGIHAGACTGVGTAASPCELYVPDSFDFGSIDTSGSAFQWKSGWFHRFSEPYVLLSADGKTLSFYCDNSKNDRQGTLYELNTGANAPGWFSAGSAVTTVVFDSSFATVRPTSTYGWFQNMAALTTIEGLGYLHTDGVTDMTSMFSGCSSLFSLDLSSFVTSSVTDMHEMFRDCSGLTSLVVSGFDTSNVTSMYGLFFNCAKITTLDVSGFSTSSVTNMGWMFAGCSRLTSLVVSGFDTSSVTNMYGMFVNCTGLTTIDVSGFDTSSVTDMGGMFYNCTGLTSLDVSGFDTSSVTSVANMFYGCSHLTSLDLSGFVMGATTSSENMLAGCSTLKTLTLSDSFRGIHAGACTGVGTAASPCELYVPDSFDFGSIDTSGSAFQWKSGWFHRFSEPYVLLSADGKTLSFYCDNSKGVREGTAYELNTGNNVPEWGTEVSAVTTVVFAPSFDMVRPTTGYSWFSGMAQLTAIEGMEYLHTEEMTTMSGMFSGCELLTSLDVSGFNTSNVTDMSNLFAGCSSLTDLDVSGFITDNVTDMSHLFDGCASLTSLDVSGFITDNVTDMSHLFDGCSSLADLDVSSFITDNVTNMNGLFKGCSSLTDLDLISFFTDNVTDMGELFSGCAGLSSLDLISFITDNVTDMNGMFAGCTGLTDLDLSGFVTDNVTDLSGMFSGCTGLTALDLTAFDTTSLTSSSGMLANCSALADLTLPLGFSSLDEDACEGVGTQAAPCKLNVPDDFDFGSAVPAASFQWKGGWFGSDKYAGLPGDANEDGHVTVADVMLTVNKVLGKTLSTFNERNADVNSDSKITVSDVMGIVKIVLSGSGNSSAPSNAFFSYTDGMALTAKGSELTLHLMGTGIYTATQMTLTLPEGCCLESAQMVASRSNGHSVLTSDLGNGHYRVVIYSASGLPFGHSCTDLLRLRVSGHHNGDVAISDIQVVDYHTNTVLFSDVSGITTGIDGLSTDAFSDGDWYTTQGQRVSTPTRGVYIRNGQKVVVR